MEKKSLLESWSVPFNQRLRFLFTLNSLPAAKVSTTMERVTNAELAGMHPAYGAENGNSRETVRVYVVRYPNRHVAAHQNMFLVSTIINADTLFLVFIIKNDVLTSTFNFPATP